MVASSARPSEPCAGSFTSISVAPPVSAVRASSAERTLTSKPTLALLLGWSCGFACIGLLYHAVDELHGEKTEPAGIGLKRQHLRIGELKAIQHWRLKPFRFVVMFGAIGGERCRIAIGDAAGD